ncbi:MAG: glycosyltransferase family A protein [Nanoarchaeota archaeon]
MQSNLLKVGRNLSLAIIVSALNEEKSIRDTLLSLEVQDRLDSRAISRSDYCIIVVDNGSEDSTLRLVEGFAKSSSVPVEIVRESTKGIVSARLAGVRYAESKMKERVKYIAFCDADVIAPSNWVSSMLSRFESSSVDVLSYTGTFPHRFWKEVPNLVRRYVSEVGTLFFPAQTIKEFDLEGKNVVFTDDVYSRFVRPPSGGFYAIRKDAYDYTGGYKREFTSSGKEVDGPTWRMYAELMRQGARLEFVPEVVLENSERRLLGDPERFFGIQTYDQLGDLSQNLRETGKGLYSRVDLLADSIDFEPVRQFVIEYYILFPCVTNPSLIGQNQQLFGDFEIPFYLDISNWRKTNMEPTGQAIYAFCDQMAQKYGHELISRIKTAKGILEEL